MIEPVIFAENTGTFYQIDSVNIKLKIEETFDDYANRHFWEKGIYYDYEIALYYNKQTGKLAFIGSYWDIKGKVFGCADCAMTKLWYVKEGIEGQNELDLLREALRDFEVAIPHKVFAKFVTELDKELGLKLYKEEELIKL